MTASERDMYSPLPAAFIADRDSTINIRSGHQEEVGYNPHKPGRGTATFRFFAWWWAPAWPCTWSGAPAMP